MKSITKLLARLLIALLILFVGWLAYYWYAFANLYTSDAYVQGQVVPIVSRITAPVKAVLTKEGQLVKKGDPLLELDNTKQTLAVDIAKSKLKKASAKQAQLVTQVKITKANIDTMEQTLKHDKQRLTQNLGPDSTFSENEKKEAKLGFQADQNKLSQYQSRLTLMQQQLSGDKQGFPLVTQAQSKLKLAQLRLSNTIVRAPISGYVTHLSLTPGTLMKKNKAYFSVIGNQKYWVRANYNERQIQQIRLKETATVTLSLYGSHQFSGTVSSISHGVLRQHKNKKGYISHLPNALSTLFRFFHTVRFPVRIDLAPAPKNMPYRVGASAQVVIDRN